MKSILFLLLGLVSFHIHAQDKTEAFDGHTWKAPYHLPIPKDWTIERFQIPIQFAPEIRYSGVEDIRFAPGWAKISTDEYWTYAFLWYLDGEMATSSQVISRNLTAYYTGLYRVNTEGKADAIDKMLPVIVSIKQTSTHKNDKETYSGSIEIMDYIQLKPILLNCIIHVRFLKKKNKTVIFYELSPKPYSHQNWKNLDQLWSGFKPEAATK